MDIPTLYHRYVKTFGDDSWTDTVLHIHAGMAILMLARLLTRRSLGSFVPFAFVLVAALGNEVLDRMYHGIWRWPDTIADIVNTIFWPFVISLGVRLRPFRSRDEAASAHGATPPSPDDRT